MLQQIRTRVKFLAWMMVGVLSAHSGLGVLQESLPDKAKGYPIYTKGLEKLTVDQIKETLSQRPHEKLKHTEAVDLITALMWSGEYDGALELANERLSGDLKDKERSSFHACVAVVRMLQANEVFVKAESLSLWQRHVSRRGRREKLLDEHKDYLRLALEAVIESCRLNPGVDQARSLAAMRVGIAHRLGDPLAIQTAQSYFRETHPMAAGEEVMEPITGIVILAAAVIAGSGVIYATTPSAREDIIECLPRIITLATAAIVAIETITAAAADTAAQ